MADRLDQIISHLDERLGALKVAGNVLHQALPLRLRKNFGPECVHLAKVVVIRSVVLGDLSGDGPLVIQGSRSVGRPGEAVGEVVGEAGVVRVERHRAVALVIQSLCFVRAVDGELQIVGAQAVAVSVGVREETALEHLVRASLDAGHHMSRTEGDLLHLGKVVLGVAVQDHPADGDERELGLGPHLGQVERVPAELFGLLKGHDLDLERPGRVLALGDGVVQVTDGIVGIVGRELMGLGRVQIADSLVTLRSP